MKKKEKPIIFISHVHEDADIVNKLQLYIKESFLNAVDVFVSSDGSSIRGGDQWLQKIEASLRKAELVLTLVTNNSAAKKWLYFEAGGAFFLGARVVPLLDQSISLKSVGPPLNYLHVYFLSDPLHLQHIFSLIAELAGMQMPSVNFQQIANELVPLNLISGKKDIAISTDTEKKEEENSVFTVARRHLMLLFATNIRKMKDSTGDEQVAAKKAIDQMLKNILPFDPPLFFLDHCKSKCIDDEKLYFLEDFIKEASKLIRSADTASNEAIQIVDWLARVAEDEL